MDLGPADIWALGIMLYITITCEYPFGFDGPREHGGSPAHIIYKRILEGGVEYPDTLSAEAIEMLRGMFITDPAHRWTTVDIQECAWFKLGERYEPTKFFSRHALVLQFAHRRLAFAKSFSWGATPMYDCNDDVASHVVTYLAAVEARSPGAPLEPEPQDELSWPGRPLKESDEFLCGLESGDDELMIEQDRLPMCGMEFYDDLSWSSDEFNDDLSLLCGSGAAPEPAPQGGTS